MDIMKVLENQKVGCWD